MEIFTVKIVDTLNGYECTSEYDVLAYTEEEAVECALSHYMNPPF